MGSPISATIANLVLEELEEILQKIDFEMVFFKRFMDDCLTCIPINKVNEITNLFNSYHERLQFTYEIEENKRINFLDMNISYDQEGKIKTNWYQKPTNSNRYLNYNSTAPQNYKKSVINSLVDRAVKLTDPSLRPKNMKKIKTILNKNSYPENLVNKCIANRVNAIYNGKQKNNEQEEQIKYIGLEYIPGLSNKIENCLKKYNFKIGHKTNNYTKKFFTKLKPKIQHENKTHCIYEIKCNDCEMKYIGNTKQYLHRRIYEHKYSVRTNNKCTALAKHSIENLHGFDFDNTQILTTEMNCKKRNILEMMAIHKENNAVNSRADVDGFINIYNNIIE